MAAGGWIAQRILMRPPHREHSKTSTEKLFSLARPRYSSVAEKSSRVLFALSDHGLTPLIRGGSAAWSLNLPVRVPRKSKRSCWWETR